MSEIDDLKAKLAQAETSAELYLQLYKACSQNLGVPHTQADLQARLWTLKHLMRLRSNAAENILKAGKPDDYQTGFIAGIAYAWAEGEVILEKCVYTNEDLMQFAPMQIP